jgi:uridylate kinase
MSKPAYRRVLVKVSGEALQGKRAFGIDPAFLTAVAKDIVATRKLGAEIAVMVGGGNFIRGATTDPSIDRAAADQMGMLATIINAIALGEAIDKAKGSARVMSAVAVSGFCEPYSRQRGLKHLENGHVVVLGGGTGNPFFTTDTGAALRAAELRCNAVFKATNVDGVYDSDPDKNKKAKRFEKLSHDQALAKDLKVMDAAAFALARDAKLPIIVFSIRQPGAIAAAFSGKARSTTVTP